MAPRTTSFKPRTSTAGLGRTMSLTSQRREATLKKKDSTLLLQQYQLSLPANVDLDALKEAVNEAEKNDVDSAMISEAKKKIENGEKLQAKKREAARLAKLQERREACAKELAALVDVPALEVNRIELGKALDEAQRLTEEDGDPYGFIDEDLIRRCHVKYSEAEAAWEARRKGAEAALEHVSLALVVVDSEALRAAATEGQAVGLAEEVLARAHSLLGLATKRDAAASKLKAVLEGTPVEANLDAARKALAAAAAAATPAADLVAAQLRIRAAEEAQAPRTIASGRLERVLAKPAESLDTAEVRAAKVDAAEVFVAAPLIERADAALRAAADAGLVREAATVSLLSLAAPRAPSREETEELQQLLPMAAEADVASDVVDLVQASLDEAIAAEAVGASEYANGPHCARLKAATERTAKNAPDKHRAAQEAAEATAAAETVANDKVAAAKQAVGEALDAAEKVTLYPDPIPRPYTPTL